MADKGDGAEALDEETRERRNFVKSVMRCRTVVHCVSDLAWRSCVNLFQIGRHMQPFSTLSLSGVTWWNCQELSLLSLPSEFRAPCSSSMWHSCFCCFSPHQIIWNVRTDRSKYYLDVSAFLVSLPNILYNLLTPLRVRSQNSQLYDLVRCGGIQAFTVGIPHQIIQNVPNIHSKYYLDVGAFLAALPQILYYFTTQLNIQSSLLYFNVTFIQAFTVGIPPSNHLYCNLCTAKGEK